MSSEKDMSNAPQASGFSFHITESPPPARAGELTPLGDLDLDMGAFSGSETAGSTTAGSETLGSETADRKTAGSEKTSAPIPSPFSPLPQPVELARFREAPKHEAPKQKVPEKKAPVGGEPLVVSTQPSQRSEQSPNPQRRTAAPAPSTAKTAPTAAPTTTAAPQPSTATTAASTDATEPESSAPRTKSAPRIKKIAFPARAPAAPISRPAPNSRAAASAPTAPSTPAAPSAPNAPAAQKSSPTTRFSPSISSAPVRSDSEPPPGSDGQDDLLPQFDDPDDLPVEMGNEADESSWGTETPDAREIWRRARRAWQTTSRQALVLGGQGLKASAHFAHSVGERARTGIEEAQARRAEAARAQQERQLQERQLGQDNRASEEAMTTAAAHPQHHPEPHLEAHVTARATGPSTAGMMIMGLAKATAKKVAAPLSAAGAAVIVYFAGSHFLGVDGRVALSRAVQAPEVPDLGTLEEGQEPTKEDESRPIGPPGQEPSAGRQSSKTTEMQVEITEMPDGLSWPGKGLIEVVTSEDELIYVDDVFTGRGPLRRVPVSPGSHEISIKSGGNIRNGTVEVTPNKSTRAVFKSE